MGRPAASLRHTAARLALQKSKVARCVKPPPPRSPRCRRTIRRSCKRRQTTPSKTVHRLARQGLSQAHRKEIQRLQSLVKNEASANESNEQRVAALNESINRLEQERDAALRERDALTATVARLGRREGHTVGDVGCVRGAAAKERTESQMLRAQLAQGEFAPQSANVRRRRRRRQRVMRRSPVRRMRPRWSTEREAQKEAKAAMAEAAALRELRAEANAATEAMKQQAAEWEAATEAARKLAEQSARGVEAKGESSSLARRLAGMVERKEEREKGGSKGGG